MKKEVGVDFENLENELYIASDSEVKEIEKEIDSEAERKAQEKQLAFDFKQEADALKEHFLRFTPEGYTREDIEKMNDDEIVALKAVYESHCF